MRYYPLSVTGEILNIVVYKDDVPYNPGLGTVLPADGHNFTIAVTVKYHGEKTSGGRVYGYVWRPSGGEAQYDDDPDHWPYDDPETEHVYYIDFGPIDEKGVWVGSVAYTRVISGVETVLASWFNYLFTAGPVIPPAEVTGLGIASYVRT